MGSNADKKPVYLRGIPSEVVREAKAAAARRGLTLAGFVTDTLSRALQRREPEPEASARPSADIGRELRWYERQRAALTRDYAGQYVAIVGQRVIDHDPDFEALAERVFASHAGQHVFMPRVAAGKPSARVRSPRLRRQR